MKSFISTICVRPPDSPFGIDSETTHGEVSCMNVDPQRSHFSGDSAVSVVDLLLLRPKKGKLTDDFTPAATPMRRTPYFLQRHKPQQSVIERCDFRMTQEVLPEKALLQY